MDQNRLTLPKRPLAPVSAAPLALKGGLMTAIIYFGKMLVVPRLCDFLPIAYPVWFINTSVRGSAPQVPGLILSQLSADFVRVNDIYRQDCGRFRHGRYGRPDRGSSHRQR
jgi:hypothetical protein